MSATGPAKILAVDDEADFELLIRQHFRRQIRTGEFAFRFAHHGEEALAILAEEPEIELLLLDINMPVMDGLTLLTELQARQVPVRAIIVSAYGDMANIRTAMNRGAFDFVTKPVDLNDLDITIKKTLAEIARIRELDRRRAAAERARTNLSRYLAEPGRTSGRTGRAAWGGSAPERRSAVRRYRFTRMSEKMAPEAVVTMLRQFHDRMTAQIFACGGTVEKYIGDAIFAVFGLPTAGPDDAVNALRCAEGMIVALDAWNTERERQSEPPLAIGIGLNYGPAVIGDVGSEHSLSFTVIGDTVNTASRLQTLTRRLGTPLVVGDALVKAIAANGSEHASRLSLLEDCGEQILRGRSAPVRIWTRVTTTYDDAAGAGREASGECPLPRQKRIPF
jgi:adenylate cyclase